MKFGQQNSAGFSLLEALLALALFSLVALAFAGVIIYGEQTAALAGQQARAAQLVEEGQEAARNIRDQSFNNLQDGSYGLAISGGVWTFNGGSDTTGIFSRQVTIAPFGSSTSTKDVLVTVTWQQDLQRTGEISSESVLSNWRSN